MSHAEIGILFGERMSDATLMTRYAPLVRALGSYGVEPVIIRAGANDFDATAQQYARYSTLRESVERHEEPTSVDLIRDFSGKRDHGTIPAINDPAVWELTRDKANTYRALSDVMPQSYVLSADRSDAEDARQSLPGTYGVIKPTLGRASQGVSVVELQDASAWNQALAEIAPDKQVIVEEYIDTTHGHMLVPGLEGRPYTTRVIAIDGEPSAVIVRAGHAGDQKVLGDDNKQEIFLAPEVLTDGELEIVARAHQVAAEAGNGFSYLGVDLLEGDRTYLGELNSRPGIIEPSHDPYWSRVLADDSAHQLISAHTIVTDRGAV